MKANICSNCLEKAIGDRIQFVRSVVDRESKCEVCGKSSIFYARQDELQRAKELTERTK